MTSEQLLTTYAQTGEESLFDELVRRHHAKLLNWLCKFTKRPGMAIELAQTSWVNVFLHCRQFSGRSKFVSWLISIARNAALSHFQHLARRSRLVPLPFQEEIPARQPKDSLRPEVAKALRRLSSPNRHTVYLVDLKGLTYPEAAERLKVDRGTIASRRHRAIQIMRRELVERERLPKEKRKELSR